MPLAFYPAIAYTSNSGKSRFGGKPMIFESHAHYDDEAFDGDRETLLAGMQGNGIEYIINVGADLASTQRSIALAERYTFIYAAVGVHPDGVGELNEENFQWLREQCAHPKAVAVGEIGLDYYWDTVPRQQQREWFVRQMELAVETKLPVIIHSREAAAETFALISRHHAHTTGGVIHCYSYSKEMALEYVKMGYHIGIGGVVTFKKATDIQEAAKELPLDKILVETDAPYLAPVPKRGRENKTAYTRYVVDFIAELRGMTSEEVAQATYDNARKVFGLD